jgi:hypothetical protein
MSPRMSRSRDLAQRGQAMTEHLLLTACVALVLLVPLTDAAPAALLARAVIRFARAFVTVIAWS